MRSNWLALGAALCAFAATGPEVHPSGRALAVTALVLALSGDARRGVILGAALLGILGAVRLGQAPPPPADPSAREVHAIELTAEAEDGRASAWARRAGEPARRVRVRGLGPDEWSRGARLVVLARRQDLARRSTPDRRAGWRSARARGVEAGLVVSEVLAVVDRGAPGPVARWRRAWARGLDARLGASAGLWRALVLADRSSLDPRGMRAVQNLGLAHLLALSGLHTSIVAAALLWPLRRRGRRVLGLALPALVLWVVVAGGGASITRAVGMASWWVVARHLGRPARVEDALAAVALLELALRPHLLCGVGWWLSYAATIGVLRALDLSAGWPGPLRAVAISVSAQLSTAPWVLDAFGLLSLSAPLTLLVIGPAFAVVLIAGLGGLALGALLTPLAGPAHALVALAGHGFGLLLAAAGPLAGWTWRAPGLDGAAWAGALLAVAAVYWPGARAAAVRRPAAVLGLLLAVVPGPADHEWICFDVGQGDGMVLRCGSEVLVVDTGPRYPERSPAAWTLVDWLERRRYRKVGVLITHGHLDHRGGHAELLGSGRVDGVTVAATDTAEAWTRRVRRAASARAVPVRALGAGEDLRLGHCRLRTLWPGPDARPLASNDRSLVLQWDTPAGPILLTGDLERAGEAGLLSGEELPGRVGWLKVAHHGGDTGTDTGWLERLRPAEAVISCGAGNRHGHPHSDVIARLESAGVRMHRTDRCGFVRVRWNARDRVPRRDCGRPR